MGYWTKERVVEVLEEAWENLKEDESIILMEDVAHSVGITRWALKNVIRKYPFDPEIKAVYQKIDEQILSNIVSKTASKEYSVAMMIFILKNRYGWADKRDIKHKGVIANIGLNDAQFQKIIEEEVRKKQESEDE